MRLRRRLNTVLLQWFLLFVLIAGTTWVLFFPGIRRSLIDDRLLVARTIAQSLDATISNAIQSLGRLSNDVPLVPLDAAARLRVFRFQSPFGDSTYLIDHRATLIASDPAEAQPVPASWLGYHEAVTPLVRKTADGRAVLAIVQPFNRDGSDYYLISEMNPRNSFVSAFLKDLQLDPQLQVSVTDENGIVVAATDPSRLLQPIAGADGFAERIRAHRPQVIEDDTTVTVMAPLRLAAWGVVIQQSNAQTFAGLTVTGRGLLVTGFGLAVMGVLLARTLSRSVVTPLQQLSQQAAAMRGGDLSSAINVTGDYEIETLANTLDAARIKLRTTLAELQGLTERLEDQVVARTKVIVQQDEQRKVLVRRLLAATEDERRRLARELHDEIAQLLSVIQMSLDRVEGRTAELQQASDLLVRTQKEVHRIIYDLRPSLLDDLGLSAAMKSYAHDHLTRQGLSVNLEIEEGMPPRPEIETVIFRIYQELVTNVLRHAHAEQVSIELYQRDGTLVLVVDDDGDGFDVEARSGGAGTTGMRERADLVNGTIHFDSEPGSGTHVTVEIPLQ